MKTVTLQYKNKIKIEKTIYLNATETEVQLARFYMANRYHICSYILLFEEGHTVRILSSFEFMAVCKNSAVHTHARLLK